MDLSLSESQKMLRASARAFLMQECPTSLVRAMEENPEGYTEEFWRKLVDLGWLGLVVPEKWGGIGEDFLTLALLLEEMGCALAPGPYFSTVVLGALPLIKFGTVAQKDSYLRSMAEGETLLSSALTEISASYYPTDITLEAKSVVNGYLLDGTKFFVPDAHVASAVLVPARTSRGNTPQEGITVFIVPTNVEGYRSTLLKTVARDKQCEVILKEVSLGSESVLGEIDQGWTIVEKLRDWAAVGTCALMVGNANTVLEMTLKYVKERSQFGKPVGSFQAIQHFCADMATQVAGARDVTYRAAWKLAEDLDAAMEVSLAKAWVSKVNQQVLSLAHQSHGAIGFTWEHDLPLYTRRAKAWEFLYGDPDFHRDRIAQFLGL
jgi:alkylation response protein AidB-like acyl-CoA dehydrogenase